VSAFAYPVALDLEGRACLVVGGGEIAARKLAGLLEAGARVTVVSPWLCPALLALASAGRFRWMPREYAPGDVAGFFLAVVATGGGAVDEAVAREGRERGVLVNCADDPARCDFILPAVLRRGAVMVAVSTGGASPAMAGLVRDEIDALLPDHCAALADVAASARRALRERGLSVDGDRWRRALDPELRALVTAGRPRPIAGSWSAWVAEGRVVLVGAGPGDAGLITVRGLGWLRRADVVVHDRLVSRELLAEVAAGALVIFAGKAAGAHCMPQSAINALLIHHARAGRLVVRLKGGDPFVFGRGGEEMLACRRAGVPVEVVPGVSSALAAPAAAAIPLSHRGLASSFAVVTGHEDASRPGRAVDWEALALGVDTLVILMGTAALPSIAARVIAAGRDPAAPAAVVSRGTTAVQQVVTGTLADIAERAAGVGPPAVIVIGAVVDLAAMPRGASPSGPCRPTCRRAAPSRGRSRSS
jgi:uroporphyrin-III C-methyltransferase/precorrin-2 dehydrogenase/sirohydrochlorin ferrochelatase